MKRQIKNTYNALIDNFREEKRYLPIFLLTVLFSILLYSLLIKENLVNHYDGLWHYSYRESGIWEISIGRWFLCYLDRLHFCISLEPISSILSLSCLSLGMILILSIFDIKDKKSSLFINGLFLSNVVVCSFLSYRYESLSFSFSFLLSIFAVYIMTKMKGYSSVLITSVVIAIMMGTYQANLGCTCITILLYLIYMLHRAETTNNIKKYLTKGAISIILGGILYIFLLNIHLQIFNVQLASYKGANNYSIANSIINFPNSMIKCYKIFKDYFFGNIINTNIFQISIKSMYLFIFAVVSILLINEFIKIFKENKFRALIYVVLILLIPLACNSVFLIATQTNVLEIQMTAPLALFISLIMCIIVKNEYLSNILKIIKRTCVFLFILILYGNIYMVQIDQNAMFEGRNATVTLAQIILDEIKDREYLDVSNNYYFNGRPADNKLFKVSTNFKKANKYARFGEWWDDDYCNTESWNGVFSNLLGINLNFYMANNYDEVENMPSFPSKESFVEKDNVIIIKVAD